ncbi:DUF2784 domain-containing protein [Aquabacterium sp.]|uniref:DUF2784 domain-containing protein n=1 Tax=Aquabacterium sp. TaxID=1872578 RepID=UPI00198717B1|nr:DUF2784 domain-containing protein [Aquabacterium sp.]MBC7700627.1 DUF2784 domain-containing protein [Aquabacterium sp.]
MPYAILASSLVVFHLAFVLFVVFGAGLLFRWPGLIWLHVPALIWGIYVEFTSSICPLTPLENRLRFKAGQEGYDGGFIDHYIISLLYPDGLTPTVQLVLGILMVAFNLVVYGLWIRSRL